MASSRVVRPPTVIQTTAVELVRGAKCEGEVTNNTRSSAGAERPRVAS